MLAPEILFDDRASTLVPLIAKGDRESFRQRHRSVFDAQGFGRFEESTLCDGIGFERVQRCLQTAPSPDDLKAALLESGRRLVAAGYTLPSPIRVRIGVGGSFDGKNANGTLMFSLDRVERGDELALAAHELSHLLLNRASLSLLPLPLDQRLVSEAVAIVGSIHAAGCRQDKAVGLPADVCDELEGRLSEALSAFRASRVNNTAETEFPAKPFLGGSGKRFDRYGYFLAEKLLSGLSPAAVCALLADDRALAERVAKFLGTSDLEYAGLLAPEVNPNDVVEIPTYAQLAAARLKSWNGRFGWIDVFAQMARTAAFDHSMVLDVGCGTGHNLRRLVAPGGKGLGIDPSEAMLAYWVDDERLERRCCGLFELDDSRTFTLIVSAFDTFNHILVDRVLEETVERLYRLLVPGGRLVFDFITKAGLANKVGVDHFDESDSGWQVVDVHRYARAEGLTDTLSFIRNIETGAIYLERHRERAVNLADVVRALHKAGFIDVRAFDSTGVDDATPDTVRIFMHARRPD